MDSRRCNFILLHHSRQALLDLPPFPAVVFRGGERDGRGEGDERPHRHDDEVEEVALQRVVEDGLADDADGEEEDDVAERDRAHHDGAVLFPKLLSTFCCEGFRSLG